MQPRALARWPSRSAMVAHDAQCAAAGVTTVLDALCLGDLGFDKERIRTFRDGVADLDALADAGPAEGRTFPASALRGAGADMLALFDPVAGPSARAHGQPDGPQPRRRPVRRSGLLSRAAPPRRPGRRQHRTPHRRVAGAARTAARAEPARAAAIACAGRGHRAGQPRRPHRRGNRRERRRRHPHQRIPGHHGGGAGGEGGRHAGDRRRAEHRARRLAFRQRIGGRSAARPARSMRSPRTTCRPA